MARGLWYALASIGLLALAPMALLGSGMGTYWVSVLTRASYYAVFVLSLDVFSGTTGYLNLGHQLFIGIAAYVSGYLNVAYGIPPVASIPVGVTAAALAGLAMLLPSLRVRGVYFSLLSFFIPIIFMLLFSSYPLSIYLGGEGGLVVEHYLTRVVPRAILEDKLLRPLIDYYVSLALTLILTIVGLHVTLRTRLGVMMRSIGEDEVLARASGVKVNNVKAYALLLSSLMAGLAGALYYHYVGVVTLDAFSPVRILVPVLAMWIVGGPGSIVGPVAASYLLVGLEEATRPFLGEYNVMVYMALLLVLVAAKPTGLLSWVMAGVWGRRSG